jgi:tetratricopeptide (TPR) repeat protein
MRDNLDLKQLAKEVRQQKNQARLSRFFIGIALIITAFTMWLGGNTPFQMYVNSGGGWRGSKGYDGTPQNISTSPDGVTWLLTSFHITLNRWTGDKWEQHSTNELEDVTCVCGMATDKENVWIATEKGVYQFNGKKWKLYPEAVKNKPVSIAASELGVYVIDATGNLSHFDGQSWSITNIRELLPSLRSNTDEDYPLLFAARDGSILAQWNGIWNFDGATWEEIIIDDTNLDRIPMIGTAHNRLWTEWGHGIVVSSLEGGEAKEYYLDQMGLSPEARVYRVNENLDGYLFATNEGLIRFDGKEWQKISLPDNEATGIKAVESNPKGDIWVLVAIDVTNAVILQLIYAICPTILIIALLITLFANARHAQRRLKDVRPLIEQALPDLPTPQKQQNPLWLIMIFGAGLGLLIVFGFLGQANLIYIPVLLLIILFVITEIKTIRTTEKAANFKERLSKFVPLLQTTIWLVVLWAGMNLIERINPSLATSYFVIWVFITIVLLILASIRTVQKFMSADSYEYFSREYAQKGGNQVALKYNLATTAFHAGHLDEAEKLLRECIAQSQNNAFILSNSLSVLSLTMMYQKRYEEAMKLIEIDIQINPTSTTILTSLAEIYLEQAIEPERILELTSYARRYTTTNWLNRLAGLNSMFINDGVRAWALTKLGRVEEGEALIQNAIQRISKKYISGTAYLYFMKGKIEILKGNPSAAIDWLTHASQTSSGLIGQLAANALKGLSSSQ